MYKQSNQPLSHAIFTVDQEKDEQAHEETALLPGLTLRVFALAFIARFILDEKDDKAHAPETQFLRSQYTLLASTDEKWQPALMQYLSKPSPEDEALIFLAGRLNLSVVELLSVALALGVEEDALIGRSIAYVQAPMGGARPTLGLIDAAYAPLSAESAVDSKAMPQVKCISAAIAAGRAVHTGLLNLINETAPLPEQAIKVLPPLALALRGSNFFWPGTVLGLQQDPIRLPPSILEMAGRHAISLTKTSNGVLVIRTSSEREARAVACVIAKMLHSGAIFIDSGQKHLLGLGPLCLVRNLVPIFRFDPAPGEHLVLPQIPGYNGPVLVLAGPDGTIESPMGSTLNWTVPIPKREERNTLWHGYLADAKLASELAKEHLYSAGRIAELSRLCMREAQLDYRTKPNMDDVRNVSWTSEGCGLGALALPIKEKVPDKALVLHPNTRQELLLLEQRCRERETLGDNLGITIKARYQVGVRALFVGSSGTGKTLAAGWLATHLGLPLYRVDIASVTSKYIGETEKNLAKLLARAEQDEVVLLFDEADSLFGKRTDVKDANDRYANAQTNYLLQRIETYKGIVLLTSNSRARFDSAFTRRLDMIIEFPLPSPEERRALWQSHLGTNNQLTAIHLNQLAATCDLCGGHIRNAVLSAAVLAQSEGRPIGLSDIVQGLACEYRKLGRQMSLELKNIINKE